MQKIENKFDVSKMMFCHDVNHENEMMSWLGIIVMIYDNKNDTFISIKGLKDLLNDKKLIH